jgi:hypothetical protein
MRVRRHAGPFNVQVDAELNRDSPIATAAALSVQSASTVPDKLLRSGARKL